MRGEGGKREEREGEGKRVCSGYSLQCYLTLVAFMDTGLLKPNILLNSHL